jgi:uncharacterized membrane protein YbhN (UPF0104 family)
LVVAAAILAAAGGCVLLSPPVLRWLLRIASRLTKKTAPALKVLSYRDLLDGALVAVMSLVLSAASFAALLNGFADLAPRELLAAGAAYTLASVAGMLVLPVPSGFGVREGILIGLLQTIVPVPVAIAAAALARVLSLTIDVLAGGAAASVLARRHAWSGRRASTETQLADAA